jgi:hypothetical protein
VRVRNRGWGSRQQREGEEVHNEVRVGKSAPKWAEVHFKGAVGVEAEVDSGGSGEVEAAVRG